MRTLLITGADRGIGEALCLEAASRGDRPIAACLSDSAMLRSQGIRVEPGVDVRSDESVRALAGRLSGIRIDVLLNVAGIHVPGDFPEIDMDGVRQQLEVNTLGPLRVTQALLPCLGEGSKIGIVTSRVGSLGDNQSGGHIGYRISKAAGNMLGLCLALDLKARGIAVICLHPGTVRTEMTRHLRGAVVGTFVDPTDAARGLLARMDELTMETTGTFRHANGEALPW
jgi:NAD(P)-dependent dehydrogenase (short-subunit alcohol dehydrogenase family)